MTQPPLTVADATNLHAVLETAEQSARVAWVFDGCEPRYGTARHIVKSPDNYGFLNRDDDVRDGYLRITTQSGMDVAYPVIELMDLARDGLFMKYDW